MLWKASNHIRYPWSISNYQNAKIWARESLRWSLDFTCYQTQQGQLELTQQGTKDWEAIYFEREMATRNPARVTPPTWLSICARWNLTIWDESKDTCKALLKYSELIDAGTNLSLEKLDYFGKCVMVDVVRWREVFGWFGSLCSLSLCERRPT